MNTYDPALTVIPVSDVVPGMVVGHFAWGAPGGRILDNMISTRTVRSVSMEPVWDTRRQPARYVGQRVTVAYFDDAVSSLTDADTVVVVGDV